MRKKVGRCLAGALKFLSLYLMYGIFIVFLMSMGDTIYLLVADSYWLTTFHAYVSFSFCNMIFIFRWLSDSISVCS